MAEISVHQAKVNFSQLLSLIEKGEEVIIEDEGYPIAKLVPWQSSNRRACLGRDKKKITLPDDFDAPLPESILAAFEGK